MKKYGDDLFQIGEVAKILGVTRKTLLVYEDMGLLAPAVKDEDSGFRYYTADNMTQIRAIRSLQVLGLSLKEVKEYYTLDEYGNIVYTGKVSTSSKTMKSIYNVTTVDGTLTVKNTYGNV